MANKSKFTNVQLSARGNKRVDNGEIQHKEDKLNIKNKDNVRPEP